ncbi:MAG TPA: GAF domain-containing protein, partial [Anaerolineae bacterium]
ANLLFAEDDIESAIRHYKSTAELSEKLKDENLQFSVQTLLGKAYLANKNPREALKATTRATDLHRATSFAKPDTNIYAQEIWWWHAQALLANRKKAEAYKALEQAHDLMLDSIKNIRDVGLRRNALNKVEVNRSIIAAWLKSGGERKLPKERLYAHLEIESNVREPFQRLADTGVRLNALHTAADIQAFLVQEVTELTGGERVMLILEQDGNREVRESIVPLGEGEAHKFIGSIEKYLDRARLTRIAQLDKTPRLSRVVAPLIAQNNLIGYLYADMDAIYGRFDETDRDMLGMLANQGAVALDNAHWAEGLERKVEERTAELNARVSELAIINSVQHGLASKVDFQGVIDIVGDKIREIFASEGMSIALYDSQSQVLTMPYFIEHGDRYPIEPTRLGTGFTAHVIRTQKPLVINQKMTERMIELGSKSIGDEENPNPPGSYVGVPILKGGEAFGVVALYALPENAFSESDVRLLQTLTNSMSVALENARLFDETQRLLQETEQRAQELAIINSVQAALAAKLDIQGIYEVVGDKIREIFQNTDMGIRVYDPKTNLIHYPYGYEDGKRIKIDSMPNPGRGFSAHVFRTRETLVINENMDQEVAKYGSFILPGTQMEKSAIYVPLVVGEEARGLINLSDFEREHAFSESDVRLLQTLANSMSVALENARLFDETQRLLKETEQRAAELAIINSVQQGLASKLDFQGVIDLVGDELRRVFHTDDIGIRLYDRRTDLVHYPYEFDHGQRLHVEPRSPMGVSGHVISTRQPLVVNSQVEQVTEELGSFVLPGTEMSKSFLAVPIIVNEQATGLIVLDNYEKEYAFSSSDVRLLQTLANSMSVALENARLFDETQRLLQETEQRNAELAIINSVQAALAAKLDMQGIYDAVGDKVRDIFDAQSVLIGTADHATRTSTSAYIWEKGQRYYDTEAIPWNKLAERLIATKEPIVINQFAQERADELGMTITPGTEMMKSGVFVPLIAGGQVTGVVSLQNVDRENAFTESDVRLLQTLANSLSVALENARLFDETQRLLQETEQRNAELAIINSV